MGGNGLSLGDSGALFKIHVMWSKSWLYRFEVFVMDVVVGCVQGVGDDERVKL